MLLYLCLNNNLYELHKISNYISKSIVCFANLRRVTLFALCAPFSRTLGVFRPYAIKSGFFIYCVVIKERLALKIRLFQLKSSVWFQQ